MAGRAAARLRGGIVKRTEQTGDGGLVLAARAAGQAGVGAGALGGGTEGIAGALQRVGAGYVPARAQRRETLSPCSFSRTRACAGCLSASASSAPVSW